MKIEINKRMISMADDVVTLGQLLRAEGLDGAGRAVAVDGEIVRRGDYENFRLADGMKITVIRAFCGG